MSASADPGAVSGAARILFVTSNGTGLGHLTRAMAIARRLSPGIEPLFFTLSAAASVVREAGFPVEYIASHGSPGAGNDWRWSRRLGPRLRAAIAEAEPNALFFDGILPWDPLLAAIKPVPLTVWCRRGLWRRGASAIPLTRTHRFDAVLEPGEFAAAEDRGPTAEWRDGAREVAPIVFCDDEDLLPRADAERELGLEPGRTNVLVQLGQGEEVAGTANRCLRALAGRDGVQVAAMSSAIERLRSVPEGVVHLDATYPVSRYYAAFDAAVSAAGYNAFHELIRFRVPSVFVPMERETDDQAARANCAERRGVGVAATGPDDPRLERLLPALLDVDRRRSMRERLDAQRPPNGAPEAARWLEELLGDPLGSAASSIASRRVGRSSQAPPGASLRQAGAWLASVPRTLRRLGSQSISMARPRTLVIALGIRANEVERRVRKALDETEDPPEHVLVVTDSPAAIGPLRHLGVGVEHVPAADTRQAALAGGDYEDFVHRRLGLILAHRPRLRRTVNLQA